MTGTFRPNWDRHKDNPDFEFMVYSNRLQIDDYNRTDLVTRAGEPVEIRRITGDFGQYAHGTIAGKFASWYHSYSEASQYHTFVEHADAPSENDVMLPKSDQGETS